MGTIVGEGIADAVAVALGITDCVGLGDAVGWGLRVGVIEGETDGDGEAWLQLRFMGPTPTLCKTSSIFGERYVKKQSPSAARAVEPKGSNAATASIPTTKVRARAVMSGHLSL